MSSILLGDGTPIQLHGRGYIDLSEGTFHDVLYIPYLSTNLPFFYSITHTGSRKQVEFTLDTLVISEMRNGSTIVVGKEEN